MLLRQKLPHLTKNLILSVDETNVVGIGEHDDSTVRNLSAEMFDFLLVIFLLCFE